MKAPKFLSLLFLLGSFTLSLQAQVIKREGYIITNQGDSLRGKLWTGDTKEACQEVKFQVEGGPVRVYQPHELQAYGFGGDQHYRSFSVPRTDKNEIYHSAERAVFLHLYRSGDLWIYELEHEEGRSLYLSEERESPQLMYYALQDVKQEDVRLGVIRLADGTEFSNLTPGMIVSDPTGRRYYFTDSKLMMIVPQYQFDLMGALPEGVAPLPANFPLNKPKILQTVAQHYELQKHNQKPRVQLAVLAYQQITRVAVDEKAALEGGILFEARANRFTPKVSLRLGLGRTNWIVSQPEMELFRTPFFMQNVRAGAAYHFRPGKNLRPFVSGNVHMIRLSRLGNLENAYTRFVKPGFSMGLDVYPMRFSQFRFECGYSSFWYASISTGLVWAR
ncbi:MAG: hypothetical protein AAF927_20545 [Bacteroidota bacterium]